MKATIHRIYIFDSVVMSVADEIELPKADSLSYMQKIVDGYIDIYYHERTKRDWIVNDKGLLLELPLNPWALAQGLQIAGNIIEIHGVLE